jgi:hypothetical protein
MKLSKFFVFGLGACAATISASVRAEFEPCPLPGDIHQCERGTCMAGMVVSGEWTGKPADPNKSTPRTNLRANQSTQSCDYDTPGGPLKLQMHPSSPYTSCSMTSQPAIGFNCSK